jgi:mono/diheme cytochrome c family protein
MQSKFSFTTLFLCIAFLMSSCGGTASDNPPVSSLPPDGQKSPHAQGEKLFRAYCASCHNPHKDLTGPALKGSGARMPSKEWLYQWVHNPQALLDSKDAYAVKIYEEWKPAVMTAFPNMTNAQIDEVMAYIEAQ